MSKSVAIFIFALLIFTACSNGKKETEIKIATNSWIGYAPLFYAKESGALEQLNIKLIHSVSLAEASEIFEVGKADLVTTTQHEFLALKESVKDLIPIILIDRSNGGDMILANKTLQELKKVPKIDAYLETDSINNELLHDFLQKHSLDPKKINYINKDQLQISNLSRMNQPTLVVTYSPYNKVLEKNGFVELASTKDIDALIVIDALCIRAASYAQNKKRINALKAVLDKAIEAIQQDPKKSYERIAKYLGNISYEEYKESLHLIKWINKDSSEKLRERIKALGYEDRVILQ